MRGKNYNVGLRGVLFEARHYARMGQAVWLFGWLVLRQTRERDGIGFVLGGRPVTYREIEEETGFTRKSLERWMRSLREAGYVETTTVAGGIVVRIQKAKKFVRTGSRKLPEESPQHRRDAEGNLWKSDAGRQPLLEFAGPVLNSDVPPPQIRGGAGSHPQESAALPDWIGSGALVRQIEKQKQIPSPAIKLQEDTTQTTISPAPQHRTGICTVSHSANATRRTFRAEEVSRELQVGAGPEVLR